MKKFGLDILAFAVFLSCLAFYSILFFSTSETTFDFRCTKDCVRVNFNKFFYKTLLKDSLFFKPNIPKITKFIPNTIVENPMVK